jgi:hypothetical protein
MSNEASEKLISILESINRNLVVISQSQEVIARALAHIDQTGLDVSADAYAVIEPYNGNLQVDLNHVPHITAQTQQA